MTTQYIELTAVKIIQPDPARPGGMVAALLNPKQRKLIPLSVIFTEEPHTGAAAAEMGTHAVVFEESFEDVLNAIGAFSVRKGTPSAKSEPRPFPWGESQFGKFAAERAAAASAQRARMTGAHQGELSAEEALGQILQEATKESLMRRGHGLTTDEVAAFQAGTERQGRPGDLRIVSFRENDFFFEMRHRDEDGHWWKREGVPAELKPGYTSLEAATEACRLAGYSRRLVTE